jgi:sialate O-acetylesterase
MKIRDAFPMATVACLMFAANAVAGVAVDTMFSDHMVLQREQAVPIWGTADAGAKVTVTFRGQSKETTAGQDGKWMVKLDSLKVGEAADLTVVADTTITFKDVLVGEVWVGSGQSNMAGGVGGYARRDAVLKTISEGGPYSNLRLYDQRARKWAIADKATIQRFSAIHFSFGYALQQELKVPVGLMYYAVGGRPSGLFITPDMVKSDPAVMALMAKAGASFESMEEKRLGLEEEKKKANEAYKMAVEKAKADGEDPKKIKAPGRIRGAIVIGGLYKGIASFVPYGIRGVLWDQGESKTQVAGVDQYTLMNALINGWRKEWDQGDFWFLHVQKPSGGCAPWDAANPVHAGATSFDDNVPASHSTASSAFNYPLEHIKMGTLKNAPLVTAVDLGTGIHPSCKSGYGKRASIVALGTAYGRDIPVCGPVYTSHTAEGETVRVSFEHVGSGLAFKHADTIRGFEIAGSDGKWEWANATIDGATIVLSHENVTAPTMVQYAFHKNKNFANLYNKEGWPALMFTTATGK